MTGRSRPACGQGGGARPLRTAAGRPLDGAEGNEQRGRERGIARRWRTALALVGIVAILQACAYRSGTSYSPIETGAVMRVEPAQIVSSREVVISGLDNSQAAGWGTVVGATIAGAAAYGITGADNPAGVAMTIIAAVVGGLAGLAAEERRQTRPGAEYILRGADGETIAVAQSLGSGEGILQPGADVSLIHGARGYVRVVPVPG